MSLTNAYLKRVYEGLEQRCATEKEFLQAVEEVLESLEPIVEKHPEYEENAVIERLVEPERVIMFRVPWVDDNGKVQVNRGYRVHAWRIPGTGEPGGLPSMGSHRVGHD